MALKDLLVQIDPAPACGARLDLAARLARDHEAHLVGLYVVPHLEIPTYVKVQLPPEAWTAHAAGVREAVERAEGDFRARVKRAGVNAEFRSAEGDPASVMSLHARYADVTIVGQADPTDPVGAPYDRVAEEVLLGAGRPVLIVPYAGRFATTGEWVLIAWNASREAARAVNDALPVLRRAKRVSVLAINPRRGPGGHGDLPGADIALHLARHGVNVEAAHLEAVDIDVGNMLLSRAADVSADLIVMGGYGRARLRELVLGGATRHILEHMTVPVLMSH